MCSFSSDAVKTPPLPGSHGLTGWLVAIRALSLPGAGLSDRCPVPRGCKSGDPRGACSLRWFCVMGP